MAYDSQCGSCEYFEDSRCSKAYDSSFYEKGYCSYYKSFYYPDDSCRYYKLRGMPNGGCYITTIVCDILGKDDDDTTLNTLRNFRNNYLQKDIKYKSILYNYDVVGPKISNEIYKDYKKNNNPYFCSLLFSYFIEPISNLINNGNNNEAVDKYIEMTECLMDTFNISNEISNSNYDNTKGGHGYCYYLKKS